MPKVQIKLADVENAAQWLKQNRRVSKKALTKCGLDGQRFGTTVALHPELYLRFVTNIYKEAQAAKAPRSVLGILREQVARTRGGLENLPKFAYSWFAVTQILGGDIKSKTKTQSILRSAILRAPDAKNKAALKAALKSALNHHDLSRRSQARVVYLRRPGGGVTFDPNGCIFCCVLACGACTFVGLCIPCCVVACVVCGML